MKRANTILVIILSFVVVAESRGQRQVRNDDVIKVDVTKSYSPKKEFFLQDIATLEYVVLETNDDFVNQGVVIDIGKEYILVKNRINDGDIFVYDRTGKALRKINRRGEGSEEYLYMNQITLDEDSKEIFVYDSYKKKFFVYDLYGNFKRSFNQNKKEVSTICYSDMYNYDRDNLICYDFFEEKEFVLISKQDGSITKNIKIPFKEKKSLMARNIDGENVDIMFPIYSKIIPFNGSWLLLEISSDTVFTFLPDYSLRPLIVRTPSVQSMNPEVMLVLRFISDRYYFMETMENKYDFKRRRGFNSKFLMYDKQEKVFLGYTIYDSEYSIHKEVYLNSFQSVNHEIEYLQTIEASELVENYKNGQLKEGKLKEIAAKLDEEDNPVIMLVKHKK